MRILKTAFVALLTMTFSNVAISKTACSEFSWSIIKYRDTIIPEVFIYNPGPARQYHSRVKLTLMYGDKKFFTATPLNGDKVIWPKTSGRIRFHAPLTVLKTAKSASIKTTNFRCAKNTAKRNYIMGLMRAAEAEKRDKKQEAEKQALIKARKKAEESAQRTAEIYDNCIIDLMPNTSEMPNQKQKAIVAKCKRISENPSLIDKLRY